MLVPTTTSSTDAEVIVRSWDEPDAFEEIYRRHHATIYRYVVRRVGPQAAADVAAEVFVQAFAGRRRYRREFVSARPWLFGIATNLLRQHLRSRSRSDWMAIRLAAEAAAHPPEPAGPADDPATGFETLRTEDRTVLILFAFKDLTYREIATELGIPIGTVRSRLARARRQLRRLLDHP